MKGWNRQSPQEILARLDEVHPKIDLGTWPTPIEELSLPFLGDKQRLFVKREDLSSAVYGGSKVRNLERILGHAQAEGAKTLLTTAAWGSHMVYALARHSISLGFGVRSVLFSQFDDGEWQGMIDKIRGTGAVVSRCRYDFELPARLWAQARAARKSDGCWPYWVAAGGASPQGSLGYLTAALEIEKQVQGGVMPEPDTLVVPLGSCGSYLGLLEGLALTSLKTQVLGVRVVPRVVSATPRLGWMRRRLHRALKLAGVQPAPKKRLNGRILHNHYGRAYARPTEAALQAKQKLAESCELKLETTYGAKAMAAILDQTLGSEASPQTILFLNTYCPS